MKNFKLLFALYLATLLPACGSVMEGATQTVLLQTPGAEEVECTMDNGRRYIARSGQTLEIMKSRNDLVMDCYAAGNRHKKIVVESETSDWAAGNVVTGVVPGVAYDHFSGGLYKYPDVIVVDFVGMPTTGFGLPDYHYKDAPNPYNQSIEDYGPSTPRVVRDSTYMKRGLEKRDVGADSNPFAVAPSTTTAVAPVAASKTVPAMTPTKESGEAAIKPTLSGNTAEALTRSANPSVFSK